jgi:transketolase C-terminal domain/subunit
VRALSEQVAVLQRRANDITHAAAFAKASRRRFVETGAYGIVGAAAAAGGASLSDGGEVPFVLTYAALSFVAAVVCAWRGVVWHRRFVALDGEACRARQAFYRSAS